MTGRLPGVLRAQPFDRRGPANPHAPSRIEIDLHHRVLHFGRYGAFDADFMERSRAGTLLGRQVRSPHVVDQALTALSQALMFSEHPNYVWVGDAVRAMGAPEFDWDEFWNRVIERDIVLHACAVVDYLRGAYQLAVRDMPRPAARAGLVRRGIHAAEISAMGSSRVQRGLSGRLAMLVAEFLRSRSIHAHVSFRTDYTLSMRPAWNSSEVCKRDGDGFTWAAAQSPAGGVSILVRFAAPIARRVELDLWSGERPERTGSTLTISSSIREPS